MKTQQEIEELSTQALNSLDNLQSAEANAFLYRSIMNRMSAKREQEVVWHTRLMFRLSAALVLFIAINITSLYIFNSWQGGGNKPAAAKSATSAFSDEFLPKDNSYTY